MGPLIRPLVAEDRPDVEDALVSCAAFNEEEVAVALELFDAGQPGGYWLFGAQTDGRIHGYVCLAKAPLTRSTWYLYWICVHANAQGRGVGSALQRHGEAFVRSHGGERLVLETSGRPDYQRARQFYERAGYRLVGRIEDFYRPGDDCVIYAMPLAS